MTHCGWLRITFGEVPLQRGSTPGTKSLPGCPGGSRRTRALFIPGPRGPGAKFCLFLPKFTRLECFQGAFWIRETRPFSGNSLF
eukprot:3270533-Rhodomonas_salina.4